MSIAWAARNARSDIGSTLMVTFAAALVALLARPDPHRMITRLLASIRQLAAASAVLTFAGAPAFALVSRTDARPVLGGLAVASLIPTALLLAAWATAMKRSQTKPQRSPWEQHRPRKEEDGTIDDMPCASLRS